jgi:phytanoyl-CoA hydroxylase
LLLLWCKESSAAAGAHAQTTQATYHMTMHFIQKNILHQDVLIAHTTEADHPSFISSQKAEILQFYDQEGYVVVRNVVSKELLDEVNNAFDEEVKGSHKHIYRQTTANPEINQINEYGYVVNPILNVQSLCPKTFPTMRKRAVDAITCAGIQNILRILFSQSGKLVQSMYFHGNPATWPHQDSYYLDAHNLGSMTAVWCAAEDIKPGAGNFFVYPGSHRKVMTKSSESIGLAYGHEQYKQDILRFIEQEKFTCRAPLLMKGDVLFWHAFTIHGSLPTASPQFSRRSLTAHYIPEDCQFIQFQRRIKPLKYDSVNGVSVSRPKDLGRFKNRMVFEFETRFPKTFAVMKRNAVRLLAK